MDPDEEEATQGEIAEEKAGINNAHTDSESAHWQKKDATLGQKSGAEGIMVEHEDGPPRYGLEQKVNPYSLIEPREELLRLKLSAH